MEDAFLFAESMKYLTQPQEGANALLDLEDTIIFVQLVLKISSFQLAIVWHVLFTLNTILKQMHVFAETDLL